MTWSCEYQVREYICHFDNDPTESDKLVTKWHEWLTVLNNDWSEQHQTESGVDLDADQVWSGASKQKNNKYFKVILTAKSYRIQHTSWFYIFLYDVLLSSVILWVRLRTRITAWIHENIPYLRSYAISHFTQFSNLCRAEFCMFKSLFCILLVSVLLAWQIVSLF